MPDSSAYSESLKCNGNAPFPVHWEATEDDHEGHGNYIQGNSGIACGPQNSAQQQVFIHGHSKEHYGVDGVVVNLASLQIYMYKTLHSAHYAKIGDMV